jgi:hypothetical protein
MKKKKRKILRFFIVFLLLILLIPIPGYFNDGGSFVLSSLTYDIVFWHTIRDDGKADYYGGTTVILFHVFTVYDTAEFEDNPLGRWTSSGFVPTASSQ